MATANEQDNFIDQPSEEIIELDDERGAPAPEPSGGSRIPFAWLWPRLRTLFTGLYVIVLGIVVSSAAAGYMLYVDGQHAGEETKYIEQSSQLLMLSQRIAKDARESVSGRA